MNRRAWLVYPLVGLYLFACQPKSIGPTVTLKLEFTDKQQKTDDLFLEAETNWSLRIIPETTQLRKGDIAIQGEEPNVLKLTVPEGYSSSVADLLESAKAGSQLGFHLVHPQTAKLADQVAKGETIVPGYISRSASDPNDPMHFLIKIPGELSNREIKSAVYVYSPEGHSISVDFTKDGAQTMDAVTTKNVGSQLAIVLGDQVLSAPVIRQPFSTGCLISGGGFTESEAMALAKMIEFPPPAAFKLMVPPPRAEPSE